MASPVSVKSQPLHKFSLPHLKWKNHRSGRSRLTGETFSSSPPTPWRESPPPSRRPSPLHKQSPRRDSESDAVSQTKLAAGSSTRSADNHKSKGKRSNKICIRFGKNGNIKQTDAVLVENHASTTVAEGDELLPKTWNLRPRRPPMNPKQSNGSPPKIGGSPAPENRMSHPNNIDQEGLEPNNYMGKSKKQKFSIALSREEIEEDIFSLTGSKPPRSPKKRPRIVQKQIDTIFPGLWLGSITLDSYKVTEAPTKG